MKSTILTAALVMVGASLMAQTIQYENLPQFDKLVVSGDVKKIEVTEQHHDRPQVLVLGVDKEKITTKVEAGVLYLNLSDGNAREIVVKNSKLKRVETENDVLIAGVETVGNNGKYLITDYSQGYGPFANHVDINIPNIDIDVPGVEINIPAMGFNFDHHFDHDFDVDVNVDDDWDFDWDWDVANEEIQLSAEQVREEVHRAMEQVREQIRKVKKD